MGFEPMKVQPLMLFKSITLIRSVNLPLRGYVAASLNLFQIVGVEPTRAVTAPHFTEDKR